MALLDYCQYKTLAAHSDSLNRLEVLLRSARPESWQVAFQVKRLRERVDKQAYLSTEEVIGVFSGLLREGRMMGPASQEVLEAHVAPLIAALGLSGEIHRAAEMPIERAENRARS